MFEICEYMNYFSVCKYKCMKYVYVKDHKCTVRQGIPGSYVTKCLHFYSNEAIFTENNYLTLFEQMLIWMVPWPSGLGLKFVIRRYLVRYSCWKTFFIFLSNLIFVIQRVMKWTRDINYTSKHSIYVIDVFYVWHIVRQKAKKQIVERKHIQLGL